MSSKETMEELKERPSTHQAKVFTSMVYSLKVLAGTDKRRNLRTHNQRSFTINSQFFMFLLSQLLSQQEVLQVQVLLPDKRPSKLRKLSTNVQFTSTQ